MINPCSPTVVEKFLPKTQEVCADFVGMIGTKVDDHGFEESDFLEELKKFFVELTAYFLYDKRIGAIKDTLEKVRTYAAN